MMRRQNFHLKHFFSGKKVIKKIKSISFFKRFINKILYYSFSKHLPNLFKHNNNLLPNNQIYYNNNSNNNNNVLL